MTRGGEAGSTGLHGVVVVVSSEGPIAQKIVAFADRLTRLATVRPGLRLLRNAVLSALARLPAFRNQLAWRLSGLVYR